jgi:hypothetical protein
MTDIRPETTSVPGRPAGMAYRARDAIVCFVLPVLLWLLRRALMIAFMCRPWARRWSLLGVLLRAPQALGVRDGGVVA